MTGSKNITCISAAFIRFNNGIPTVIPMFFGSGYTTRLLQLHTPNGFRSSLILQPDPVNTSTAVENSLLSSMRAEICTISNPLLVTGNHLRVLTNPHKSKSLPTSLSVLPDPEIRGEAVEISMLACIEAEIYVISFLLPVIGRHL